MQIASLFLEPLFRELMKNIVAWILIHYRIELYPNTVFGKTSLSQYFVCLDVIIFIAMRFP